MSDITFFGETTFRNRRRRFGIKADDRRRHFYVIGKTGMGKTAMMENMAIQDIRNGKGIAFIDPHGEAAEKILNFIPASRINDVVYFNPGDLDFPIAFNVMESVGKKYRHLVVSGLMGVFKKIFGPEVWSARMEYILNYAILALLEYPGSTLLGINRILADPNYRKKVLEKVTDSTVKSFWVNEFAKYSQKYETEATAAIQNKVGQFISDPLIRNFIGQVKASINFREIMDTKKILIANLSKGRIGEENSSLSGALLITKLQLAAMSRVEIPEEERNDFYLYVDEFQNFATESFAIILSEARKYRLNLILGHQYINQMDETVRDAVFGNVGTLVVFRVGAEDAEFLEKEFSPYFLATDIVNLKKYSIYVKLMINGLSSKPFSAETLPPLPALEQSSVEKIIAVSRERYGNPREAVEKRITDWTESITLSGVAQPAGANQSAGAFPARMSSPQSSILYDAKCSACGKDTKLIFPPDGKRPVYCKVCLKKMEKERMEKLAPAPTPVLARVIAPTTAPVPVPTPAPAPVISSPNEPVKLEQISFSSSKKYEKKEYDKPKRKEINLGELKKLLHDSLGKLNEGKPSSTEATEGNQDNEGFKKL